MSKQNIHKCIYLRSSLISYQNLKISEK